MGSGPHMELCCTAREQRGEKELYLLSLFCPVPYPYRWNSATDIQSGLLSLADILYTNPHRYGQRFVSYVVLNPANFATQINLHKELK